MRNKQAMDIRAEKHKEEEKLSEGGGNRKGRGDRLFGAACTQSQTLCPSTPGPIPGCPGLGVCQRQVSWGSGVFSLPQRLINGLLGPDLKWAVDISTRAFREKGSVSDKREEDKVQGFTFLLCREEAVECTWWCDERCDNSY